MSKDIILITPGHGLVTDTLIMYGIVDELFRTYAWINGTVNLQGQRYVINLNNIRPSSISLPEKIRQYQNFHISCGGRLEGKERVTAKLEISPTSGKFERVGAVWKRKQYKMCHQCEDFAEKALEVYAGKRNIKKFTGTDKKRSSLREYWILSPVEIQLPLILSIKGLEISESIGELGSVNLPIMSSLLAFLSILPSPLPGRSWLFSIYSVSKRLESAYIGGRADNIHRFIWTIRKRYIEFPSLIRRLIELVKREGNLSPLVRLTDVAMTPSLSLAYSAIRELRLALEKSELKKLGEALIEWCQA
ncbi:MAG: hypothetical protein QXX41_11045 [Nitrososphaerota archaeon]